MSDPAAPSAPRRATVTFIFVTVVLDVLALGIIIPVLPELVKDFVHGDTVRATYIYGLFGTVWGLMQVIFSPVMGALSDRYGRRRVILLSNFGLGFDYLLMAVSPTVGWLFLGRTISGITGASFTSAAAYIADITPPEKRAASYGMIGAAWGIGFVLGPALGGVLGAHDPRLPFWVASALTLVNAAWGLFVLPESLPVERRRAFSWKRANPVGSFKLLRSHHELFGLAAVALLYYTAHQVFASVFVLYAGYRYNWTTLDVGLSLALIGVLSAIVQGRLVRPLVARFGERKCLVAGLSFGVAGMAIFGLAPTGVAFLCGTPVMMMMGLVGPSTQGLMSRRVGPSEQGELQGANTAMMALTGLWGPTLYTTTFAASISALVIWHIPGLPFFIASLLLACAIGVAVPVTRRGAREAAAVAADTSGAARQ